VRWPGWPAYDSAALSEAFRRSVLPLLAPDGPTAGTVALDPQLFLARLLTHIPDPGQVMTRYYGWYASRTPGPERASHVWPLTADG